MSAAKKCDHCGKFYTDEDLSNTKQFKFKINTNEYYRIIPKLYITTAHKRYDTAGYEKSSNDICPKCFIKYMNFICKQLKKVKL